MLNDILRIAHIIGFSLIIGWGAGVYSHASYQSPGIRLLSSL
jgi:hypothetical protein